MTEKVIKSRRSSDNETATPATPGWRVLAVLSLLMGFASISTDLYLPAMPMMSHSLHAKEEIGRASCRERVSMFV
jgi:MFS transporter, DHA1 family, multidrug resistance protein